VVDIVTARLYVVKHTYAQVQGFPSNATLFEKLLFILLN
jgi:hypothetical protein